MSDASDKLSAGEGRFAFETMWLETITGTRYAVPDMGPGHVTEAHRQLIDNMEYVTLSNLSGVVLVIPIRIVAKAGVADRCFWERT